MVTLSSVVRRLALALLFVVGCSHTVDPVGNVDGSSTGDTSPSSDVPIGTDVVSGDSAPIDAPTGSDSTPVDASMSDDIALMDTTVGGDGSSTDAPSADIGTTIDLGMMDLGTMDLGTMDTAVTDTGIADAGRPDVGVTDTGPACVSPMSMCGSVCTNVATDPFNCSACGRVCTVPTGGSATCASGVCSSTCPGGSTLCGSACQILGASCATTGTSTCQQTGTIVCSGSSAVCSVTAPLMSGACASPTGGVCTSDGTCSCSGTTPTNCSGTCTNITTDMNNCGACGLACGTTLNCIAGSCTCAGATTFCSGACTSTATDVTNCGTCGTTCTTGQGCSAGLCCAVGLTNCSSTCTNLATNVNNCGACGRACGTARECLSGVCTAPPAPRPVAPLSTATVTSQTPTFHWVLGTNSDGAQLQICTNRAMTTGCVSIEATGATGVPTGALSPGVHFWQLTSRLEGIIGTATSPVWEFVVGHLSAPLDTSWGTLADFNGDGYADIAVGAVESNSVYVYAGSASGLGTSPTPTTTLTGSSTSGDFGCSVASAGDINGDGYADLVVGDGSAAATAGGPAVGQAYVYLGGPSGLATTPATTLTGTGGATDAFGSSVASAGDVNGDGYADVVVGASCTTFSSGTGLCGTGQVDVYLGSAGGLATTPVSTLTGPDGTRSFFGGSVASAGDVNADGYADLIVGAELGGSPTNGEVNVYLGSSSGPVASTMIAWTTTLTSSYFGVSVASAGDVNGDGYADVVVGADGVNMEEGMAFVFLGGAAGVNTTASASMRGANSLSSFGASVASAGDVNGDGYSDVVIGAYDALDPTGVGRVGAAYIYLGSPSGLVVPLTPVTLNDPGDVFGGDYGCSVAGAGDVNGDGYDDIVVGAKLESVTGHAFVYEGTSGGINTAFTTTLTGSSESLFGYSVASAADAISRPTLAAWRWEWPFDLAAFRPVMLLGMVRAW